MKLKKISRKDLLGEPNKSEKEILDLLTKWHDPKRIARANKKDKRKIKSSTSAIA